MPVVQGGDGRSYFLNPITGAMTALGGAKSSGPNSAVNPPSALSPLNKTTGDIKHIGPAGTDFKGPSGGSGVSIGQDGSGGGGGSPAMMSLGASPMMGGGGRGGGGGGGMGADMAAAAGGSGSSSALASLIGGETPPPNAALLESPGGLRQGIGKRTLPQRGPLSLASLTQVY